MSEELLTTWSVDFVPLDRYIFRQRAGRLEESLLSRVSLSVLSQRGILDDSELAASLHPVATKLNSKLAHRSSLLALHQKNILPMSEPAVDHAGNSDHDANGHFVDDRYHRRKESLSEALENRMDVSEIADLGYIDDSGMAPALQPIALRLNRRLTERKTRDELVLQGIIPAEFAHDDEMDNSDEHAHEEDDGDDDDEQSALRAKKKKIGARKERSVDRHERTPSLLWRDVKKPKNAGDDNAEKKSKKDGESGSTSEYRVGDRVRLTKNRTGIVRYMGKPHFAKDERIGIELDKWSKSGHDGRVGKFSYFSTKFGHGTFVTANAIVEKLASSGDAPTLSQFKIGDYVSLKDNRCGIIRYIGSTGIVKGCLIGVELDEKSPAGHDGRFGGKHYFECPDGHGLFVRVIDVVKVIKTAKQLEAEKLRNNENIETIPDDMEISDNGTISNTLSLGQHVTLANNKKGVIKYIGSTEFGDDGEPMVGIELDQTDDQNTGDGTVGNKRYFETSMGRGVFVRRASVATINTAALLAANDGADQGGEPDDAAGASGDTVNGGGGDQTEDADAAETAAAAAAAEESDDDDDVDLEVNDYVEMENGKNGIIKFIGNTDFAKGELIGVEMETWESEGHDGSRHNHRYFECKAGHGLWTRRGKIKRYLQIPDYLKGVDIRPMQQERDPQTGKKKTLFQVYQELERKQLVQEEAQQQQLDEEDKDDDGAVDALPGVGGAGGMAALMKISVGGGSASMRPKVGDRVEMQRKRMGTIRYIGQVKFNSSDGEVLGIELDRFDAQAHDGRGYFETKQGHGYAVFKPMYDIVRLIPSDKLSTPAHRRGRSFIAHQLSVTHSIEHIHIYDRVRLSSGRTGVIRWKGELKHNNTAKAAATAAETAVAATDADAGAVAGADAENEQKNTDASSSNNNNNNSESYGIELDCSDSSAKDGTYEDAKYFNCAPNRGIFVALSEIIGNLGSTQQEWLHHKYTMGHEVALKEHFRVQCLIGGCGIVRWLGNPGFVDDLMYGIELDSWSPNAGNGFVLNEEFFQCESGKAFWVGKESIVKHLTEWDTEAQSPAMMDLPQLKKMPRMHDKVKLVDGQVGVISFIGQTEFSATTYIGVKLQQWSANGNDGSAAGKKYFKCEPGHGYFVQLADIAAHLGSIISTPLKNASKALQKRTANLLKVGDKVKLQDGNVGTVKYIGATDFEEDSEMVGIELDAWSANGHSGKVKGRTYFRSAPGCGTFARRGSIMERVNTAALLAALQAEHDGAEDAAAAAADGAIADANITLPDVGDKVELKNGNVGIVQWVEDNASKTDRQKHIQIQLVDEDRPEQPADGVVAGVDEIATITALEIEANFGPQALTENTGVRDDDIKVGAHVRLIRGKTGVIRYLGNVGKVHELVGIELDSWTHNGHDGKGYFRCAIGRGYFTKRTNIIGTISSTEKSTQEQLQLRRFRNIRKLRKKLRKISMIQQKAKNGLKLKPDQQQQLINKIEYERQLQELQQAFARNTPAIQIDDIVKHDLVSVQKMAEVALYDTVILDTGERGRVVFIGEVHFDDNEMLGIILDKWSPNAHNGSIDGKSYFVAREGHALLVPLSAVHDVVNRSHEEDDKTSDAGDLSRSSSQREAAADGSNDDRGLSNLKVGDIVQLGAKKGRVKFMGTTEFSKDEPVLGIELESWSANANDGTIQGKKYFDAAQGKGFFMRKQSYMNLADMMNASDFNLDEKDDDNDENDADGASGGNVLRRDSVVIHDISNILPIEYDVGDKVRLENGDTGVIQFIGKTAFSTDNLIGLELDVWSPNGHNGTYRDTPYFDARPGHGFFVRPDLVIAKIDPNNPMPLSTLYDKHEHVRPPTVKKSDRVRLKNGLVGFVKFKGDVDFSQHRYIGMELESKHYNGSDGTCNGRLYFSVRKGRGYFAKETEVARLLTSKGAKTLSTVKRLKSLTALPNIGDRVRTVKGKTGTVRYVGTTGFAEGTLIGLELAAWWPNGHDGTVKGQRYFQCMAGRGYFTRLSHLTENMGAKDEQSKLVQVMKDYDDDDDDNALGERRGSVDHAADEDADGGDVSLPKFKVGDRVKLQHGKTGVVRYIGLPQFAQDEVVGVELDSWSANAGDGSVSGERMFSTSAGRGYFTRRKSVANIIKSQITEGAYARLKGLLRVPKFNGKTVKIVAYVEKKQRWKVKLLHAKQEKKYLGVREENLDPILDWEPISGDDDRNAESLTELPRVGERVKTRKGKVGEVRYVGSVEFAGVDDTMIGLEMEQWDPNGHNGTVKDKMYFHTNEGRGYFEKLENLVENMGRAKTKKELDAEAKAQEDERPQAPKPAPPKVRLGDHVKLARGRTGYVKYIGATEFSKGQEVIGLELDTYDADGSEKHRKYFDAPKGRGYFTRRASISSIQPIFDAANMPTNASSASGGGGDKDAQRLMSRTKKKLREIEVLEFKHKSGVVLHPNQIAKMNRKQELLDKLTAVQNGTWSGTQAPEQQPPPTFNREKMRMLARRTSIDWTGKYANKVVIEVAVDDAVRVENGATGIVRYVGPIDFLGDDKNVVGVVMDDWHPSYGNGTIDGKTYFECDDGRGFFAHPPEITENLGSTKPKTGPVQPEQKEEEAAKHFGEKITLKDGSTGTVKFVGQTEFSNGEQMVGVELDKWSTNTTTGTVGDKEYFPSAPGRGYFARFSSISDWSIPKELLDDAKRLDDEADDKEEVDVDEAIDPSVNDDGREIHVSIGDRIRTVRGLTGVVRFKGGVHFDERDVIGVELDSWNPNGHNGIIHGHKYFSCQDGRGYFIRTDGISRNFGATRRRKKTRTASMMDLGVLNKNLKVGDHIRLARGKTGVVKWIGKSSEMGDSAGHNDEEVLGIELDSWSANANDGKGRFEAPKGRGYFTRRSSVANIILPQFDPSQFDTEAGDGLPDDTELDIQNTKRQITKVEKKLREIDGLEAKHKDSEKLDQQQMAKIDRKPHFKDKLEALKHELQQLQMEQQSVSTKTRRSLENEDSIRSFQRTRTHKGRRNSVNKEDALRNIHIGDRVRLVRGKTGIVQYLGAVDFTDEEVIGLILDKWHPNANNGFVKGKQYFKAPPGRGYFAKRALIIENLGPVRNSQLINTGATGIDGVDEVLVGAPLPKINFKIGDRVKLARGKTGLVRFVGETEFAKGEVIGLSLDTWTPAGHNGTVRGKKYFEAQDGRGYFTRRSSIANVVIPLVKPLKQRRQSITYKLHPLQIGDRIRFISENAAVNMFGKTGVVRYIGYPQFADGEVIGVELDDWSVNAHNGSTNGLQVFDTSPGRGVFARRDEIEKYDPDKEKLEAIKKKLKLGDTVILTNHRKGHIKYIGPVTGQDEMIGVELESWSPDAKDGRYDNFRYFTAPDGRGVFVKRSAIIDVIPLENDPDLDPSMSGADGQPPNRRARSHLDDDDDEDEDDSKHYVVGDRVIIDGGNKGYIRYIGKDAKNDGVYGIELDLAIPKGTDGRHNNKRYFVCRDNHAIFVRKQTILQKLDEDEPVMPQVGNRVKLTRGRFGVIQSIDEMDDGALEYSVNVDQLIDRTLSSRTDITHRRQHSASVATNRHTRRLSINNQQIKSGRQAGMLDIEDGDGAGHGGASVAAAASKQLVSGALIDDDSDNYDSDDDNYTALGETIELRSGKIGTIRFIGPVHFAKGNWIGVELHDHFGPHDGAVRGVRYFTCPPKRGIFVKQIKGRKKDDPTRQHLKRRCPECYGEFVKKRDPRAAYKNVGIVCDGCYKHGNEFSSNDWFFQCGQCEQTDFCLKCMLKLPPVSSDDMLDSYQNIRAKFKPIGTEWIFEDMHNEDEDDDDDDDQEESEARDERERRRREEERKGRGGRGGADDDEEDEDDSDDDSDNDQDKTSKFSYASVKTVFDHFNKHNDGKLTLDDIEDCRKASKYKLDASVFGDRFPIAYPQFEQCFRAISPVAAQNILDFISAQMKNQPKHAKESIETLEKVRDIFEFFDLDMDGTLSMNDIAEMLSVVDLNANNLSAKLKLFDPPCDFVKFLAKIQGAPAFVRNEILDKLLSYIHSKIEDVFNSFCSNDRVLNEGQIRAMYSYAYQRESDWRTTFRFPCTAALFVENWSTMGIYEQHGILDETRKRIVKRFRNIYTHFNDNGIDKGEMLKILKIEVSPQHENALFRDLDNFEKFMREINLVGRSITNDILPTLERHTNVAVERYDDEIAMQQKQQQQQKEEQLRHEHAQHSNKQREIINPLHPQHQQQQMAQDAKQPAAEEAEDLRVVPIVRRPEQERMEEHMAQNANQRREYIRRASQTLLHSLAARPAMSDLVDRGILFNENENFNEHLRELSTLVHALPSNADATKSQMFVVTNSIKQDYVSTVNRLHGQFLEQKQTLNQFQEDVQSREQRMRRDLEDKQRILIHMNGMIEQQKKEHQQEINELKATQASSAASGASAVAASSSAAPADAATQEEMRQQLEYLRRIGNGVQDELASMLSQTNNLQRLRELEQYKQQFNLGMDRVHAMSAATKQGGGDDQKSSSSAEFEAKMKEQQQQIAKLKQQKKQMAKVVSEKMNTLRFIHQQELQKERQIVNVLVQNHKQQIQALKLRQAPSGNDTQNPYQQQNMQMQQEMQQLRSLYKKAMVDNESLKKSHKNLQEVVYKLSTDIVKTANRK